MVVYDLVKSHHTLTVDESEIVLQVASKMVNANVGAVPVLHNGELVGIFSERDLMRRVVTECRDPATTRVGEIASRNLVTVAPNESLDNCMYLMKAHNVRHLPICEGRQLRGVVSLRDILLHDVAEKDGELEFMRAYVRSGT